MRTFYFTLALLLAVICGLFFYSGYLTDISDNMLAKIDRMYHAVETEDWAETDLALSDVLSTWEKTSPRLALFTDHSLLDEIILTASAASGYTKTREVPELCAELETLRSLVSHIPKREKLSLYNIF